MRDVLGELVEQISSIFSSGEKILKKNVSKKTVVSRTTSKHVDSKDGHVQSASATSKVQDKSTSPEQSDISPVQAANLKAPPKSVLQQAAEVSSQTSGLTPSEEEEKAEALATDKLAFSGEVLTVEGGPLKIPVESRNLCVLFDDGTWLVSSSHRHSPLVTSVSQMAQRHGFEVKTARYVTPNIILKAYIYSDRLGAMGRLDENVVRRRVVELLQKAVDLGANDVHIEASDGRTRVELRIDGALRLWETWTQKEGELMLSAIYSHSVGQSGATANWQEPQAAMLTSTAMGVDAMVLPKGVISVRCQWVPLSDGGRYLDMRLQYDSAHLFGENFIMADVDSLGFSQEQLKVVKSLRQAPGGMRVFAGPVNQGKTTTLRVTLNRRMAETNMQLNCLLVEDPPEGGIVGARQVGVSASVKDEQREKSFVEIMRCALRLDPDIVMLGEIRDIQTAKFAFRLALTGRQVYTTTHVYSALAVPQRLRDIGLEPYVVYDQNLLRGMFCQRLARGLCEHCSISLDQASNELGPIYRELKQRVRAGMALMDASRKYGEENALEHLEEPDISKVAVANSDGCEHCYRGRNGRTICAEVIETDHKLMKLLQSNDLEGARRYWLSPDGMKGVTMIWHALEKVRRGELCPTDAEFEIGVLAREEEVVAVEERLGSSK